MKKNCLRILAKLLKNILQLFTGLPFDICYVIKARVEFEFGEILKFLIYFSSYPFPL